MSSGFLNKVCDLHVVFINLEGGGVEVEFRLLKQGVRPASNIDSYAGCRYCRHSEEEEVRCVQRLCICLFDIAWLDVVM
jgi:hypothetical protein